MPVARLFRSADPCPSSRSRSRAHACSCSCSCSWLACACNCAVFYPVSVLAPFHHSPSTSKDQRTNRGGNWECGVLCPSPVTTTSSSSKVRSYWLCEHAAVFSAGRVLMQTPPLPAAAVDLASPQRRRATTTNHLLLLLLFSLFQQRPKTRGIGSPFTRPSYAPFHQARAGL